jgi:hypothetical protein
MLCVERKAMAPRTFGLTDAQLDVLMRAAEMIPHRWRARFVENVVDYLYANDDITDNDVEQAVLRVGARMFVNLNDERA